ncbi:haloacid dehalogenase-like hydrolase domain-containing protein At2g33255 [Ricinus communis]|uniref:Phosphoglycolate phosphatase, putative n=1 Tax=Ricinus communis TaxID=3988 RepID=B9RWT6_RICCO|nr:haloacid dehalogenase-like hydrolase domain-containing protein At2g33255 [Ricinus communis]XP_015574095.1 haloacid dehalogenase-like hydrolase domain-containing protein At2g33255 [Ricinus communis]EEF44338.1 Phosphoglycolate phosphatase, putative [Ricinus communis]|eukprot:XP_002518205.1 haloacid dehalogenase-like hydrolase domain-containing protein At2g33255 [Ricinus communis]
MPSLLSKSLLFTSIYSKSQFPIPHLTMSTFITTATTTKSPLRGVVFDMDGTLTVPVIDFAAMYKAVLGDDEYRRIKAENSSGIDILHHIEKWTPDKQRKAYETILDFERQGLDRLQIMPGAVELCGFLDSKKIRRGLITRNVKEAVDLFHLRSGVMFSPALSREFRPYKPDPAPLLHICSTWEVQPDEVIMVGDSLKDDMVCGKRAGAFTCLLDEKGRYGSSDFAKLVEPDFKVASLAEVQSLLETNFDLMA